MRKCTFHEDCGHEGSERSIKNHIIYWKTYHQKKKNEEELQKIKEKKWWEFWK